jgi:hypothetical protein
MYNIHYNALTHGPKGCFAGRTMKDLQTWSAFLFFPCTFFYKKIKKNRVFQKMPV